MTEHESRLLMKVRAQNFIESARLVGFGMSEQATALALDLLTDMQMRAWHEGASAALEKINATIKGQR